MEYDNKGKWQPLVCKLFKMDQLDANRVISFTRANGITIDDIQTALFDGILPETPREEMAEVATNIVYFIKFVNVKIEKRTLKKENALMHHKTVILSCDLFLPKTDEISSIIGRSAPIASISKSFVMKHFDSKFEKIRKKFSDALDIIFKEHEFSTESGKYFVRVWANTRIECVSCGKIYYDNTKHKDVSGARLCLLCLINFEEASYILSEDKNRQEYVDDMGDFIKIVTDAKFDTNNGVVPLKSTSTNDKEKELNAKRKRKE